MNLRNLTTALLLSNLAFSFYLSTFIAPWKAMFVLMLSLYVNCKWLTLIYRKNKEPVEYSKSYLLKWVGMDPEPFRKKSNNSLNENHWNLLSGLANTLLGLLFIQLSVLVPEKFWIIRGWIVCAGLLFIVHFGTLKVLAWNVRRNGFDVRPIMKLPVGARKVSEFWGGRWNRAFTQLVHPFVFTPCLRKFGPKFGVLATFIVSGLLHEVVISLPARGGWGLPTLYFLIQAFGIFLERTQLIKKGGITGHIIFTYLIVLFPAFLLFHPPFLKNVALPMARLMGAHL